MVTMTRMSRHTARPTCSAALPSRGRTATQCRELEAQLTRAPAEQLTRRRIAIPVRSGAAPVAVRPGCEHSDR